MTTATPQRLTVSALPDIAANADAMKQLRDGLGNAAAEAGPVEFKPMPTEHPSFWVWDRMVDAAIAEIAPDVARMLSEAINRRLPWTWEPER